MKKYYVESNGFCWEDNSVFKIDLTEEELQIVKNGGTVIKRDVTEWLDKYNNVHYEPYFTEYYIEYREEN